MPAFFSSFETMLVILCAVVRPSNLVSRPTGKFASRRRNIVILFCPLTLAPEPCFPKLCLLHPHRRPGELPLRRHPHQLRMQGEIDPNMDAWMRMGA